MSWQVSGLVTLAIALGMPAVVRPLLARLELADIPNHRSSHTRVTLRGAGLAVTATIVLAWTVTVLVGMPGSETGHVLVVGLIAFTTLGFVEDLKGLQVGKRLVGQFVISLIITWGMVITLDLSVWLVIIGSFSGIFLINAANFMDGINGISSLHGVILGVMGLLVGSKAEVPALQVVAVIICAAFLGFLPWNFPRAQMFLGDAGSYLLGGAYLGLAIWIWAETHNLLLALAPAFVYSFDVLSTLILRAIRGENLTEAHRDHIYQVVSNVCDSHIVSSSIVAGASALISAVAFLLWSGTVNAAWTASVIIGICAIYLYIGVVCRLRTDSKTGAR